MFPILEGNSRAMMTMTSCPTPYGSAENGCVFPPETNSLCIDPPVGGAGDATYNQKDSRRLSL